MNRVADQLLLISTDRYTPIGPDLISTGEITPVDDAPLTSSRCCRSARAKYRVQQVVYAHGYHHNFAPNQRAGEGKTFAARACDLFAGRVIDWFTTEPGCGSMPVTG